MPFDVTFLIKREMKKEKTLLEIAEKLDLPLKASCGGDGKCGKCVVRVLDGEVSEPTKNERKLLGDEKLSKGYRLACETTAGGACRIELPE